jgi:hypothetical protein
MEKAPHTSKPSDSGGGSAEEFRSGIFATSPRKRDSEKSRRRNAVKRAVRKISLARTCGCATRPSFRPSVLAARARVSRRYTPLRYSAEASKCSTRVHELGPRAP